MTDVAIPLEDIELPTIGSTLLGKYVLRRMIAKGGMGAVFEGEHNRLNQRVAVKILLPEMLKDQVVVERFSREARALASVRNPHVAAVYDVDFTPSGLPFMVMEFLEGDDLARVLGTDKTISDGTKIRWVCDVASALSEAHSLGIVHRDIKPANIILAKSGTQRIVKLVDFGVAKMLAEASVELTQEAVAVGTPRYMSPEQLLALKTIDHRADIWSLGTTLYMMLANAAPFEAADTMQLMMAIVQQPFKPLAERRPDLPTELVELIEWTLRKAPDDRPQTMAQWAEALEPFAASRNTSESRTSNPNMPRVTAPVIAVPTASGVTQMISAPTPTSTDSTGSVKKSKLPLQIGAVVGVLALAGIGFMLTRGSEQVVVKPPVEPVTPPAEVKVVQPPVEVKQPAEVKPEVVANAGTVELSVDAGAAVVDPAAQALAEAKLKAEQQARAAEAARRAEDARQKTEEKIRKQLEEEARRKEAQRRKEEQDKQNAPPPLTL